MATPDLWARTPRGTTRTESVHTRLSPCGNLAVRYGIAAGFTPRIGLFLWFKCYLWSQQEVSGHLSVPLKGWWAFSGCTQSSCFCHTVMINGIAIIYYLSSHKLGPLVRDDQSHSSPGFNVVPIQPLRPLRLSSAPEATFPPGTEQSRLRCLDRELNLRPSVTQLL